VAQLCFDCHPVLIKLVHKKSDWEKWGERAPAKHQITAMSKKASFECMLLFMNHEMNTW
jgi:hypothetical protein